MQQKRPVFINCLDLDETLMSTNLLLDRFTHEMAANLKRTIDLKLAFENWLKNHFPKQGENFEDLIETYVIDSPCGKLAKGIKYALSQGDNFAVVTFHTSENYVKFSLALMGLTKEEIDKVFIRCRDTELAPKDKNGYMIEAVKYFRCFDIIEAAKKDESKLKDPSYPYMSLLDDSDINCDAAEGAGIKSIFVQRNNKTGHITEYCDYLHEDDKEYLNVVLPSAADRFALARSLVEIKSIVATETTTQMPSAVQQISAQLDSLCATSNRGVLKRNISTISTTNTSLSCDEITLAPVLAELPEPLVKKARSAGKNSERELRSRSS